MTWDLIAGLILRYGIPLVQSLVAKWESGASVSSADLNELRGLAQETPEFLLKQVLDAKGLSADDERVKAISELISGAPTRQPTVSVTTVSIAQIPEDKAAKQADRQEDHQG